MSRLKFSENALVPAIVLSMLLWGLSWPSAKVLARYCSATNFIVYRYACVLLAFSPLLLLLKQPFRINRKGIFNVLASSVLLALYSYLFYLGVKRGQAGAGGILVTTLNPIMAYALGALLGRKLPGRNELLGLFLGLLAGAVLLRAWEHSASVFAGGNLYFLLAALSWAVMSKFTATAGRYGSSLAFSFWQYLATLLCFLPALNVAEMQETFSSADKWFWINLVFSSAIVTALATSLYFYATTRLGAEKASSYIFLVPLFAGLSSWGWLHETILAHTLFGGALGVCAVYFINKKR